MHDRSAEWQRGSDRGARQSAAPLGHRARRRQRLRERSRRRALDRLRSVGSGPLRHEAGRALRLPDRHGRNVSRRRRLRPAPRPAAGRRGDPGDEPLARGWRGDSRSDEGLLRGAGQRRRAKRVHARSPARDAPRQALGTPVLLGRLHRLGRRPLARREYRGAGPPRPPRRSVHVPIRRSGAGRRHALARRRRSARGLGRAPPGAQWKGES